MFSPQMQGDVRDAGGRTQSLSELIQSGTARAASIPGTYAMPIADDSFVNLRYGENTFNIRTTPKARRLPVPLDIEWDAHAYTGAVFFIHAVLVLLQSAQQHQES